LQPDFFVHDFFDLWPHSNFLFFKKRIQVADAVGATTVKRHEMCAFRKSPVFVFLSTVFTFCTATASTTPGTPEPMNAIQKGLNFSKTVFRKLAVAHGQLLLCVTLQG